MIKNFCNKFFFFLGGLSGEGIYEARDKRRNKIRCNERGVEKLKNYMGD